MIFQGDELFFEYMYDAHHRQQFVNNERIDEIITPIIGDFI